jgi:hypothetical protein
MEDTRTGSARKAGHQGLRRIGFPAFRPTMLLLATAFLLSFLLVWADDDPIPAWTLYVILDCAIFLFFSTAFIFLFFMLGYGLIMFFKSVALYLKRTWFIGNQS